MTLLTRTALRTPALRSPFSAVPSLRTFHASGARAALSESDHDQDPGSRREKIDHHKHDQLAKQKEGKNHWKQELSTNSESALKADSEEIKNAGEDIERLQKESSEAMAKESKS